mgnify:FL=1|jgi:hypothetical protein
MAGKSTEIPTSTYILHTYVHPKYKQQLTERRKERLGECNKETTFQILDTYYENGGNFIDTYA